MAERRPLTFPPRSTRSFIEQNTAVAWITQRDGGYEADNVGPLIRRKLASMGFKIDQNTVARTMAWLEENEYAVRSVHGRKHKMFVVDPDIDIPEPAFVKARRMAATGGNPSSTRPAADLAPPPTGEAPGGARPLPPTPSQVAAQRPPWLPELAEMLTDWWADEPEQATGWAVQVLNELGAG